LCPPENGHIFLTKSEARNPKSETNPNSLNQNFQNLFRISKFDIRISEAVDIKSFQRAMAQISETRGISPEVIIETLEAALATAYKKDYGQKGQKIKAKFNPVSGDGQFWQLKLVVDDSMLYTEEELEALKEQKIVPNEDFVVTKEGPAFAKASDSEEEAPKKVVFNPALSSPWQAVFVS
jgi:hypothetical protein